MVLRSPNFKMNTSDNTDGRGLDEAGAKPMSTKADIAVINEYLKEAYPDLPYEEALSRFIDDAVAEEQTLVASA